MISGQSRKRVERRRSDEDAGRVGHFARSTPKKVMTEQEIAQKVFSDNRERLKAERLAREATGTPVAKTKAKPRRRNNYRSPHGA